MPNGSLQSLRTTDLPKFDPMSIWNEFASETVAKMSVMPHRPEKYQAHLSRVKVGRIGLTWIETSAVTINVEGGQVGAWSAPAGDAFLLSIQEAGTCIAEVGGQETMVRPGEMVLLDASLPLPWRIISLQPTRTLTIKFPADLLLELVKDAKAFCGSKFSADVPKIALGSSLLLSLKHAIEADPDEDWDESYADILPNIVARTFFGYPREVITPQSRSLRQLACAIVERDLDDPDLSIGGIADELGTSVRTIQRAFLEIGLTPRRFILERRIATVAESLKKGHNSTSITDVALAAGFNNISYFAREFRKHMGVSAREFRSGKRD